MDGIYYNGKTIDGNDYYEKAEMDTSLSTKINKDGDTMSSGKFNFNLGVHITDERLRAYPGIRPG